ncbi:MAG: hypothetical protein AAF587_06695 [Bacteroidota bacterium]
MKSVWLTRYGLGLLLLIQMICLSIVFYPMLFQTDAYVFADDGDGLKNYFTLQSYLEQPDSVALVRYTTQNYPYGEYLYYTDNTPLLAVILTQVGGRSHSAMIMNWFVVLGLLFSTFLCHLLLKRIVNSLPILLSLSWLIPWLSPQMIRLSLGHLNLSLSWVFLLGMYLLVNEWEKDQDHIGKRSVRTIGSGLALLGLMIGSAFIHLYYLLLLGVMLGWWYVFRAGFAWRKWQEMSHHILKALMLPILAIVIVWGTIRLTDGNYDLRRETAGGYNWSGWNLNPDAMYTAYPFQSLPFPLKTRQGMNSEWYSYLGNMMLFGLPLLLILAVVLPGRKSRFRRHLREDDRSRLVWLIGLTGLGCWFTALGEYAQLADGLIKFDNPLTPFFYVSLLTDKVSHFRCMARFNWMFYLSLSLVFAFGLDKLYAANKGKWTAYFMGILLLFGLIDAFDMAKHTRTSAAPNPLTNPERLHIVADLLEDIPIDQYQAILPYPYYHVGSEEYSLTVDPTSPWARRVFQLSSLTGLPLMSSILSRTPPDQARLLLAFSAGEGPIPEFWSELTPEPILVFFNDDEREWVQVPTEDRQPARRSFLSGKSMPQRMEMRLLKQQGSLSLYHWDIADRLKN